MNLNTIDKMIYDYLSKYDPSVSTYNLLIQIQNICKQETIITPSKEITEIVLPQEKNDKIIISCDASIKKNPGGPSAVGVYIRFPDREIKPYTIAQVTPSTTNNQAEYDAVYTGLLTLINLFNRPSHPIEVRSDSQLVIRQLNKEIECKDSKLCNKRDLILEMLKEIPQEVKFQWMPRNSTPDLKQANYLAQDKLGVPRH